MADQYYPPLPTSSAGMTSQLMNCCFTHNNPEDMLMFDPETMVYLVYQEEIGESGTYHFQGYCEFTKRLTFNTAKTVLGGAQVHVERRRGTQAQAIAYCKDEAKRVAHTVPYEDGEQRAQGKRVDLEAFKEAVYAGERLRNLIHDHYSIVARYPKYYQTLTMLNRPERTTNLVVTLHYGDTGLGKTRTVMDQWGTSPEFYVAPLNNGTMWYDTYDGHSVVLLDDFSGAASHISLCSLLRLLDRYPLLVPTKGGHTWWLPDEVHVTTNILPKDWYTWVGRTEQYKAIARRIHKVYLYYVPMSGIDCGRVLQDRVWWEENKPEQVLY